MIVIYGDSLSLFARKTMVFAREKGLIFELQPGGHLATDPASFKQASPFGKIPAMKHDDFSLADSSAIVTYLDGIKRDPNLIPVEPRARARTIWFDEFGDTLVGDCAIKVFFNRVFASRIGVAPDLAAADRAEKTDFPKLADYLESVILSSGFLVEDRLTLADISVASAFATLVLGGLPMSRHTHPKAAAYMARMLDRPSFAELMEHDRARLAT